MINMHLAVCHRRAFLAALRARWVGLLAIGLLAAACSGGETPAAPAEAGAPATTAAAAPTSPLPSSASPAAAAPAAEPVTQAVGGAVTEPVTGSAAQSGTQAITGATAGTSTGAISQAAAAQPAAAQPVVTATVSANGSTAVFAPLEVDEGADCEIESHLDLVGYPELEQRMGCPTEEARFDPIGIEEFGDLPPYDRFMLWFSHEKQIYVLFPDGTYKTYADTWVEGQDPTHPCNPLGGEADSPPLPRRGFGKLWCENPDIQSVMGTVPREERLCQHSVLQRFASGRLLACFEDATVRYFRILDDSTWDVVAQ
ncbi:MAG: hypothetical protein IT329_24150 [Caldilineaceae bacterium]|nr:hypothetical protein [Caldilineaceae bacterium]